MKRTLSVLVLTLIFLALLDGAVALTLNWAEQNGKATSLVRYFNYGRSVPGKLAQWQADPAQEGNLFEVAWRSDILAGSAAGFVAEKSGDGPVIRSYGMSFVNNILEKAVALEPALLWDNHSGPGGPPNFTFSLFQDDQANRRAGDIVIFGVLSSSVSGMAALSNRTRAFEQPAPFTYPIYHPDAGGLKRLEPLINSADQERALAQDAQTQKAWMAQLATQDAFYGPQSFAAPWLDKSPFLRLVRRSLATSHIAGVKEDILTTRSYPYDVVLPHMVLEFAQTARAEGQIPLVMLIQGRDQRDANLLALTHVVLKEHDIPYFSTEEFYDPKNPAGFLPDNHFTPEVDQMLGQEFLNLLADLE